MRRFHFRLPDRLAVLLLMVVALSGCAGYPPEYLWRVLAWGDADVGDVDRFPARALQASPRPQHLPVALDQAAVQRAFETWKPGQGLDALLEDTGTQAFLVLHRGQVVYERYFHGASRDTVVTSFSVAKSFLAVLVGLAIEDGRIGSIHDPITQYLPELAGRDARFERITVHHLLRMASGIRYREVSFFHGDNARTYYHPDLRALALRHTRIDGEPGAHFLYNNYHPLLLGLILERATGERITDYLQRKLWTPMGMAYGGSWSLDSEASGFEKLESGLNARAIDFAKLGLLVLNDGRRDGEVVVPSVWMQAMLAPSVDVPDDYNTLMPWMAHHPDVYYADLWWGLRRNDGLHEVAARGNHGQLVYVSRRHQVVVVRNGLRYGIGPMEWMRLAEAVAAGLGPP